MPYFLVTFTLPAQLRHEFFGPRARAAFDLLFRGAAAALSEKLAADKGLRATVNGFTAVLHTWNQRLEFHSLRHVLPRGLRSVRYYGFCHPTAKANRLRLRLQAGLPVQLGATDTPPPPKTSPPPCPCCGRPMRRLGSVRRAARPRGPPLFSRPSAPLQAA